MSTQLCKDYKLAKQAYYRHCRAIGKLLGQYDKQVSKLLAKKQAYTAKELELLLQPIAKNIEELFALAQTKHEDVCKLYGQLAQVDKAKLADKTTPECKFYSALTCEQLDVNSVCGAVFKQKLSVQEKMQQLSARHAKPATKEL